MSANDSKKYRRERNVSFEPVHSVSVRGHRHQASDSGVGSDQDSYSTSPDRSAQAYFDLHKAHLSLKDECTKLKEELRDVNARFSALQNTVEVLEDDKEKLVREKRTLREENDKLKEDVRKARSSQPRERERERDLPKMTGALPVQQPPSPKEKTRRGESKVRRSESKRRTSDDEKRHEEKREKRNEEKERKERKEREKLHEEDKKRLKSRFDHKDGSSKDDGSVSSGSSGRKSYVEPYGPSAPRSTAERPRKSRADSTYNQIRPQVIATTTISDYESSAAVYDDGYAGEDGHYHAYPLASPLPAESRGRSRQW